MRRVHQLGVAAGPEEFAHLVRAAGAAGMRVGWLTFAPPTPPESLARAAATGVLRAVSVGDRMTVAVKSRTGPANLKDLIREHFQGCDFVLILGGETPRRLRREDDSWVLSELEGAETTYSTEGLLAALRTPKPQE